MISRRQFIATIAACATACRATPVLNSPPSSSTRRYRIGYTGITWGYSPANAETAIPQISALGYHGYESFGSVLEYWDQRGGLDHLLDAVHLPLVSAYCPFNLTNASVRRAEVAKAIRWGGLIKKCGGRIAVIGPNEVERGVFALVDYRTPVVRALNDIGLALADVGVVGALHQHTGSCVMTRDELYTVMEAVDTRVVKLAPDVGELANAGVDPVRTLTDFLPLVRHVHLKDYDGGSSHDGYCPLGRGRVDIAGVVEVVERSTENLTMMVELNPTKGASDYSPLEAGRVSREFLRGLGYQFRN